MSLVAKDMASAASLKTIDRKEAIICVRGRNTTTIYDFKLPWKYQSGFQTNAQTAKVGSELLLGLILKLMLIHDEMVDSCRLRNSEVKLNAPSNILFSSWIW